MSLGLPARLEQVAISRAFATSSHVVALVCLVATIVCLVAIDVVYESVVLWPVLLAITPMLLLLALNAWFNTRITAALFLGLGGLSLYWYALAGTSVLIGGATDLLLLTLPKIALIMVGRPRVGHWSPVWWCLGGFVLAEGATVIAAVQTGSTVVPDATSLLTTGGLIAALSFTAVRGFAAQPEKTALVRASREEYLAATRARIEAQAAAVLHDTVLNHLAAVAASPVGPLPSALRDRVAHDLEVIVGEEWLADVSVEHTPHSERFATSRFARAIDEAARLGIAVELSGDIHALDRLTSVRTAAVALATRQCLSNVARHSGTDRCEVVVFGARDGVSVMVVDAGCGFVVAEQRPDRLGLSQSIRQRIVGVGGSVQVWSTPGRGTSILLRVPVDAATEAGHAE